MFSEMNRKHGRVAVDLPSPFITITPRLTYFIRRCGFCSEKKLGWTRAHPLLRSVCCIVIIIHHAGYHDKIIPGRPTTHPPTSIYTEQLALYWPHNQYWFSDTDNRQKRKSTRVRGRGCEHRNTHSGRHTHPCVKYNSSVHWIYILSIGFRSVFVWVGAAGGWINIHI